jgi:hypothetical protein
MLPAVIGRDLATAQRMFSALVPLFNFFRARGALPSRRSQRWSLGREEINELSARLGLAIQEGIQRVT